MNGTSAVQDGWMPALDAALVAVAALATAAPGGAEVVRPAGGGAIEVREAPGGAIVTELRARTPYGSPDAALGPRARARAGSGSPRPTRQAARAGSTDADTRPATRPVPPHRHRRLSAPADRARWQRRWSTRVIVGGASSPTPPGIYQVTDRLAGKRFNGVYGARILALSAYGSPRRSRGWRSTATRPRHARRPRARVACACPTRRWGGSPRGAAGHPGQHSRLRP